jgi:hypothetical protein
MSTAIEKRCVMRLHRHWHTVRGAMMDLPHLVSKKAEEEIDWEDVAATLARSACCVQIMIDLVTNLRRQLESDKGVSL